VTATPAPPRRPRKGFWRTRTARLIGVPTPRQVGLHDRRPIYLRPHAKLHSEVPCAHCMASCCTLDVCVNAVDLARMVLPLGIAPQRLVTLDPKHESTVAPPVLIEGQPVQMLLRREPDPRIKRTACNMLAWPGGQPRCGAYAARPGICRIYPFRFTTDRGSEHTVGAPVMCPLHFALTRSAQRGIEAEIVTWRDQLAFAARVVRDWNRLHGKRDADAFFRYAVERGARKLKLDPRPFLEGTRRGLGGRLW